MIDKRTPNPGRRAQDATLDDLRRELANLNLKLEKISTDISTVKEVALAWNSAKAVGRFTKWATGVLVSLATLWAFMRHGLKAN